jgi:hypothetical protein
VNFAKVKVDFMSAVVLIRDVVSYGDANHREGTALSYFSARPEPHVALFERNDVERRCSRFFFKSSQMITIK